ncbi:MAG TPA: pyridoxal-dependent decarboxylase, partial [Blastocatellia bacterium]|nr:pyridoxal-dependent decarboxylase [Blastocatellia bacterium]
MKNEMKPTDRHAGDASGDMSAEEFRRYGHRVVDWIADYLSHPERYPVVSKARPGDIKNTLPPAAPATGESMEEILSDLERVVVPGVTHWNHPCFFAYFSTSASGPGILGEFFAAAFNVNAMLWRTSPSATELEEVTLSWLRQLMGLSEDFEGVIYDTASISTLCAIAAAREAVPGIRVREEGLNGVESANKRLRLYCSEQAHSSVDKAAIMLGIGQAGIRKVATDSEFRMDPAMLARAVEEDRIHGWLPFCVVATLGTTSTTSIDPVPQIADVCEREKLWLHVDAAYGGSASIVPEMKWMLEGVERADSLVMNPHKWLFVPMDLSVLYCRRIEVLKQAFSLVPEYLRTQMESEVKNFMDYGPQLGRRFRAIKFWFVMRYFGADGIKSRLRHHMELAREFASWVDESADFERLAPVPLSTVCFRAIPADTKIDLDDLNERLLEEVNREGRVYLSHTKLDGRFTLRLAIGNVRTQIEHVRLAWEELRRALERVNKA